MKNYFFTIVFCTTFGVFGQDWLQLQDFPGSKRDDGVSFEIDDVAYLGTGLDDGFVTQNDFFAFDLISELWSPIQSMPINANRQYATAVSYSLEGYVFGGVEGSHFLNDLWKYSPVIDSWIELDSMPAEGRSGSSNFVLNDELFIVGGRNSSGIELN